MENLEKYYTEVDRDLLLIAEEYKKELLRIKKDGTLSKDLEGVLELVNGIPETVRKSALLSMEQEKGEIDMMERLQEGRENIYCPYCKIKWKVKILKEAINTLHGWGYDFVECSGCKKQFPNMIPNNWKDRKNFFQFMLERYTTVGEDGLTDAEKSGDLEKAKEYIQGFKKSLNAFKKADAAAKDLIIKNEEAYRAREVLRDHFLSLKLSLGNWKNNTGLA